MSALRQNARGQDCTLRVSQHIGKPCSGPDTTVLCHAPASKRYGKGTGAKVSDAWAAFGCWQCHELIDGRMRGLTPDQKREGWLQGIFETQKLQGIYE